MLRTEYAYGVEPIPPLSCVISITLSSGSCCEFPQASFACRNHEVAVDASLEVGGAGELNLNGKEHHRGIGITGSNEAFHLPLDGEYIDE